MQALSDERHDFSEGGWERCFGAILPDCAQQQNAATCRLRHSPLADRALSFVEAGEPREGPTPSLPCWWAGWGSTTVGVCRVYCTRKCHSLRRPEILQHCLHRNQSPPVLWRFSWSKIRSATPSKHDGMQKIQRLAPSFWWRHRQIFRVKTLSIRNKPNAQLAARVRLHWCPRMCRTSNLNSHFPIPVLI
jgi:hypothetical protein